MVLVIKFVLSSFDTLEQYPPDKRGSPDCLTMKKIAIESVFKIVKLLPTTDRCRAPIFLPKQVVRVL